MDNDDEKFPIGYGKPPAHTRFKKGHSGNPRGRPQGSRNLSSVLERALNEKVTIKENGRQRSITKREAAVKQLANKGASGDLKSIQVLLNFEVMREKAGDTSAARSETFDAADADVLRGILGRMNSQEESGGGEENGGQNQPES